MYRVKNTKVKNRRKIVQMAMGSCLDICVARSTTAGLFQYNPIFVYTKKSMKEGYFIDGAFIAFGFKG